MKQKYRPKIEITSIKDAITRAVDTTKQEIIDLAIKHPGHYCPGQCIMAPRTIKDNVNESFEQIEEGFGYVAIDVDEYFRTYKEIISDKLRIPEYTSLIHPSLEKFRDKEKGSAETFTQVFGLKNSLNQWISFFYDCPDEEMKKYFQEEVLSEFKQEINQDRLSTYLRMQESGTKGLEENIRSAGIPNFKCPKTGVTLSPNRMRFEEGHGFVNIQTPDSFPSDDYNDPEKDIEVVETVQHLVNSLKENKQVTKLFLDIGSAMLNPYFERRTG